MDTDRSQPLSALAVLQIATFVAGLALGVAGAIVHEAYLPLLAGPCLALSGLLVLVGVRITFAGPIGTALRALLSPTRVLQAHLRAVTWVLVGLAVTAWGVQLLRAPRVEPHEQPDPVFTRAQG